ncbi:MAG TPA: CapA family protein [Candidatus Limiplasma sp.]|nr:CapA family protein [Candidatus Limiplasma sp.]HPS81325.1 CapA family protein [Candidatus Limiplasma sp.]
MLRKLFTLLLLLCMLLPVAAFATEDEEDVSIADVLGVEDAATAAPDAAVPDSQAEAPVDPAAPVYELDGSIVLKMTFTGDFTIGDNLQSKGKSIFQKELEKQNNDLNFPFKNFKDIFDNDNLTVLNFEGTLTTAGRNPTKLDNQFLFRADPSFVAMLPDNGVECVSLENNHVLDMGEDGLAETKKTLTDAGVKYYCESEPLVFTLRGVKMGMLAYQTFDQYDRLFTKVPEDVKALKAQGCEVVVVSFHWGAEKDYAPNDNQQKMAKLTIDAGADLVIGHHSHRINPIELYNGKYICYSLGNFCFAGNSKPDDMSTFVFQIKMRVKDGVATNDGFIIIPARISSNSKYNDFVPTPYTKQENIESVLSVLKKNGQSLTGAVEEYPLAWPDEE